MAEYWLYILLGFFAGFVFTILLAITLLKKFVTFMIEKGKKDE